MTTITIPIVEIALLISTLVGIDQINRHKEWLRALYTSITAWYYTQTDRLQTLLFVLGAFILISILMNWR